MNLSLMHVDIEQSLQGRGVNGIDIYISLANKLIYQKPVLNLFELVDEDYESAVKALNGKLYPDPRQAAACADGKSVAPYHIFNQ